MLRPGKVETPSRWVVVPVRLLSRALLGVFCRLEFRGRRHIPARGPVVIIANHVSYADPFFVSAGVRRTVRWLAMAEILRWPLLGRSAKMLGSLFIDTDRPRASTLRSCMATLGDGGALGIFFEGGRSPTPLPQTPKPGAAAIALHARVPILPVTIAGAFRCWPRSRRWPRRGRVVVTFHAAIPASEVADSGRGSRRQGIEMLNRRVLAIIRGALADDGGPLPR